MNNKNMILITTQVITLYNISLLGWTIKKIGHQQYELSKKITDIDNFDNFDLSIFIDNVLN